jgi:preprotein translocase subunit YajC
MNFKNSLWMLLVLAALDTPAWAAGDSAQPAAAQGLGGGLGMFMPMILIFVVFYFLLIRPQQKQAKERAKTLEALKKGDSVILASGIYGKIAGVADQVLTIEIADNVRVKALRSAVQGLDTGDKVPAVSEGKKE